MQKCLNIILVIFFPCIMFAQDRDSLSLTGAPGWMKGKFTDDYRISYQVDNSLWTQLPDTRFHILKWNPENQYLIARNDSLNPGEPGLYTRIDYMEFKNMEPFMWGFCLTSYDAKTAAEAEQAQPANRADPRKGCNGFPFSRMKRKE